MYSNCFVVLPRIIYLKSRWNHIHVIVTIIKVNKSYYRKFNSPRSAGAHFGKLRHMQYNYVMPTPLLQQKLKLK